MKLVAIRNEKVVPLATWPIRLQLHVVFAGAASAQTVPCCPFALRLNFTLTLVRRPINDKQYMSSLSFFRSNLSAAPNLPTTYLSCSLITRLPRPLDFIFQREACCFYFTTGVCLPATRRSKASPATSQLNSFFLAFAATRSPRAFPPDWPRRRARCFTRWRISDSAATKE